MCDIKVGDIIRRKNGEPFTSGKYTDEVKEIEAFGDCMCVHLKKSGTCLGEGAIEIVKPTKEAYTTIELFEKLLNKEIERGNKIKVTDERGVYACMLEVNEAGRLAFGDSKILVSVSWLLCNNECLFEIINTKKYKVYENVYNSILDKDENKIRCKEELNIGDVVFLGNDTRFGNCLRVITKIIEKEMTKSEYEKLKEVSKLIL